MCGCRLGRQTNERGENNNDDVVIASAKRHYSVAKAKEWIGTETREEDKNCLEAVVLMRIAMNRRVRYI